MNQKLHQRGLWTLDDLSAADARTLLTTARALKQAQGRGLPLKGKHVAVLGDSRPGGETDVFTAAALGLGAQVTRILPNTLGLAAKGDRRDTARVLGRLYDAIECDGLGQAFMLELRSAAAIPVSNVLMPDRHPTRMLADLMTLHEISAGPIEALTIRVASEEGAPWIAAWRQMATVTGIAVVSDRLRNNAAQPIGFLCDPLGALCADGQPAFLVMGRADRPGVSLACQQVINHRYVVQALLAQSVE